MILTQIVERGLNDGTVILQHRRISSSDHIQAATPAQRSGIWTQILAGAPPVSPEQWGDLASNSFREAVALILSHKMHSAAKHRFISLGGNRMNKGRLILGD